MTQGTHPAPVWPSDNGKQPLHKNVPQAALRDQNLYQYLVLAAALRDGRVRERKLAHGELHRLFQEADAQLEP